MRRFTVRLRFCFGQRRSLQLPHSACRGTLRISSNR